ncbi:MAG TPA: hypothetical protein DDZ40_03230 [Deltaproteobacteria bacterium]|nr:hypothetical protein [Deltaproteobacteria bacterium]
MTFFGIFYTISFTIPMDNVESTEEIYKQYQGQHATMERRIRMLLKKSYLTEAEEREIKVLKKKKLYYKDLMENLANSLKRKEKH